MPVLNTNLLNSIRKEIKITKFTQNFVVDIPKGKKNNSE